MHICENRGDYLLVEIREPLVISSAVFQNIADTCRSQSLHKVLVDLRTVQVAISTFDRYKAGVYVATMIGPRIKVAVVARTMLINYMMETAAVNRYGKLKVCTELQQAMEWLEVRKQEHPAAVF